MTDNKDNKWCVYGTFGVWGVGRIVKEYQNSVDVSYSENSAYPAQNWDKKFVTRFPNRQDALDFYFDESKRINEMLKKGKDASFFKRDLASV